MSNPQTTISNFQLDPKQFPNEPWAQSLVAQVNQFVTQVIAAINAEQSSNPAPTILYKDLKFLTGAAVAASFPIDIPVGSAVNDVHLAQVVVGTVILASANNVQWRVLSSGKSIRITGITGLQPNTRYQIRLSLS